MTLAFLVGVGGCLPQDVLRSQAPVDLRHAMQARLAPFRNALEATPQSCSLPAPGATRSDTINLTLGNVVVAVPSDGFLCGRWESSGVAAMYAPGPLTLLPDLWSASRRWAAAPVTPADQVIERLLAGTSDPALRAQIERLWDQSRDDLKQADAAGRPIERVKRALETRLCDLDQCRDDGELLRRFIALERKRDLLAVDSTATSVRIWQAMAGGCAVYRIQTRNGAVRTTWWVFDDRGYPVIQVACGPELRDKAVAIVASLGPADNVGEAYQAQWRQARRALALARDADALRRASLLAAASFVNFMSPEHRDNRRWVEAASVCDALLLRLETLLDLSDEPLAADAVRRARTR